MEGWIEFADYLGRITIERIKNINSIAELRSGTRVYLEYDLSDGSNFYDVSDSYDSVKAILMRGDING